MGRRSCWSNCKAATPSTLSGFRRRRVCFAIPGATGRYLEHHSTSPPCLARRCDPLASKGSFSISKSNFYLLLHSYSMSRSNLPFPRQQQITATQNCDQTRQDTARHPRSWRRKTAAAAVSTQNAKAKAWQRTRNGCSQVVAGLPNRPHEGSLSSPGHVALRLYASPQRVKKNPEGGCTLAGSSRRSTNVVLRRRYPATTRSRGHGDVGGWVC